MSDIIDLIINGISECWNILENFEFLGTNMLTFTITLLIIGAMLPILLTLLKNSSVNVGKSISERRNKESDNE